MAYFTFTDASNESFVVRLDDPAEVAHARALLAGRTIDSARIGGVIVKAPADYNIGWSYQLDPKSIFFFDVSTEVGDSTMRYIESHLAEVGGHLLPGRVWTGWSSELTGELKAFEGGAADEALTGTSRADLILGREGNDILFGLAGNDHLAGGAGADIAHGGDGSDKIAGGEDSDILNGGGGRDLLFGDGGSDIVRGNDGNDRLAGAGGSDLLAGGEGDDFLAGGDRADILEGGAGADRLYGGAGNDLLVGGSGADGFYFATALSARSNVDRIGDFSHVDDTIFLDRDIFKGIGSNGILSSAAFRAGTAAADASDRIVYDAATGRIYYDSDGAGGAAQLLFATVAKDTLLTNTDFVVVT